MNPVTLLNKGKALRAWFLSRTEKDLGVVIVIIVAALVLRVPFLNHPDQTLFDEVMLTNFALHIIHSVPFFDIHPPLVRMLFAVVAETVSFEMATIPMAVNQSFGDFPYVLLRFFVACFGVILPVVIYSIGRIAGYSPRVALFPALCVVFDNALVLYSRSILPDMLLLVCAFSGFAAAFAATKKQNSYRRWLLVLLAATLLGAAVSIKWTALGVVGVVMVIYLLAKMYREIISSGLVIALVYGTIFAVFLFSFPKGGITDPMLPTYDVPIVRSLEFPKDRDWHTFTSSFVAYHRVMLETNRDPEITKGVIPAAGPLAWPTAKSAIIFWEDTARGSLILLIGNTLLWLVSFFALLFELIWIAARALRDRTFPIDKNEGILLLGYLMNYLPFFFIHRPMYLYHYFTALLFLFLLLPRILPRIIDCIAQVSNDRLLAQTLAYFIGLLMLVNFFLLAPITYGI